MFDEMNTLCLKKTGKTLEEWSQAYSEKRNTAFQSGRLNFLRVYTFDRMMAESRLFGLSASDWSTGLIPVDLVMKHNPRWEPKENESKFVVAYFLNRETFRAQRERYMMPIPDRPRWMQRDPNLT